VVKRSNACCSWWRFLLCIFCLLRLLDPRQVLAQQLIGHHVKDGLPESVLLIVALQPLNHLQAVCQTQQ
jgi:hypothetical protein